MATDRQRDGAVGDDTHQGCASEYLTTLCFCVGAMPVTEFVDYQLTAGQRRCTGPRCLKLECKPGATYADPLEFGSQAVDQVAMLAPRRYALQLFSACHSTSPATCSAFAAATATVFQVSSRRIEIMQDAQMSCATHLS